jgi:hypothetical protein
MPRGRKPLAPQLTAAQHFTSADVRDLLWSAGVLPPKLRLPLEEEESLGRMFEAIGGFFWIDHGLLSRTNTAKEQAQRLAAELVDQLQIIAECEMNFRAQAELAGDRLSVSIKQNDVADAFRLTVLADGIRQSASLVRKGNKTRSWIDYAPHIFERLQRSLAVIDRTIRPGTDKGPAGKLFALLVPRMTGETPKPSTAAKMLRDRLAKPRPSVRTIEIEEDPVLAA